MRATVFNTFLYALQQEPVPVLDAAIPFSDYAPVNLSSANKAFATIDYNKPESVEKFLESLRNTQACKVLYGGYLEKRNIYKRSTYFNEAEIRNIHLGIDLWAPENTEVLAVLDGEIHSFNNNTHFGDYGPTLVLKHNFQKLTFYSLYGHLSLDSLQNYYIGKKIKQGESIGRLGNASVNGNYAPHLHLQIIRNMQNYLGDYPGVCSKTMLSFFKANCPNP